MHGNFKEERKIAKSEDSDYNVGELKKKKMKWNDGFPIAETEKYRVSLVNFGNDPSRKR